MPEEAYTFLMSFRNEIEFVWHLYVHKCMLICRHILHYKYIWNFIFLNIYFQILNVALWKFCWRVEFIFLKQIGFIFHVLFAKCFKQCFKVLFFYFSTIRYLQLFLLSNFRESTNLY